MKGPATESTTSPTMPLPPIPSTTMFSISSWEGRRLKSRSCAAAASTCSGNAIVASHIPSVSVRSPRLLTVPPRELRPRTPSPCSSLALARSRRLERRLDAFGFGLRRQTVVLGVVDVLGLVDEHDRDVILDRVLPLQARVVEDILALE